MEEIDPNSKVLVFIPALVTLLCHVEKTLGRPMNEPEVLAVRDKAVCVVMSYERAMAAEKARGYPDIVAEDVWNEWQSARKGISGLPE